MTHQHQIRVGQFWQDLDPRNGTPPTKDGPGKTRVVEIIALPTVSRKGILEVAQAPRNEKSVGQRRQFTRGQLHAHYALIKEDKP